MYRVNTEKVGFISDNDPRTRSVRGNYIENNTWVRGNTRFISSVEHDMLNMIFISSVEHVQQEK